MNLQDFTELIEITEQNPGEFGFYPMQLIANTNPDNWDMNALAVDSVETVYKRCREYKPNYKTLFLAIDFPAMMDIKHDFVMVFMDVKEAKVVKAVLLPYDNKTGQKFAPVYKSKALAFLCSNYVSMVHGNVKDFKILDLNK